MISSLPTPRTMGGSETRKARSFETRLGVREDLPGTESEDDALHRRRSETGKRGVWSRARKRTNRNLRNGEPRPPRIPNGPWLHINQADISRPGLHLPQNLVARDATNIRRVCAEHPR